MPSTESRQTLPVAGVTRDRWRSFFTSALGCALATSLASCGVAAPNPTRVITVDSLSVSLGAAPGEFLVRVFGTRGLGGCERGLEVVRSERPDSLVRRFVAVFDGRRDAACPLSPFPLDFVERVFVQPDRTLWYVVQQPDGSLLTHAVSPP
jgi:hypothetical protein